VGGAYVGGAIQSLINQTTIPLTLILSKLFLNATYNKLQNVGALIILLGACVSVLPSLLKKGDESEELSPYHHHHHHHGNDLDLLKESSDSESYSDSFDPLSRLLAAGGSLRSATSMAGVFIFLLSIIPGAFSNVYKEYAFKTSENSVDIYYMTTWVTLYQVLTGFLFMYAAPSLFTLPPLPSPT
jgi:drug/metabolite transporter (DMT)-like permease